MTIVVCDICGKQGVRTADDDGVLLFDIGMWQTDDADPEARELLVGFETCSLLCTAQALKRMAEDCYGSEALEAALRCAKIDRSKGN